MNKLVRKKRLVTPPASPRGCLCSGRREFTSGSTVPGLQWQSNTLLLLARVMLKDGGQHTCKPWPCGAELADKVTKCLQQNLCADRSLSPFSARNQNSIATWCTQRLPQAISNLISKVFFHERENSLSINIFFRLLQSFLLSQIH